MKKLKKHAKMSFVAALALHTASNSNISDFTKSRFKLDKESPRDIWRKHKNKKG